jgi:trehalose-6-phosphatase
LGQTGPMKPISLKIRRQGAILREAHAALVRAGQEQELKQAHNARVMERARKTVARAREQDRLRRCARMSALRALAAVHDAYVNIVSSTTSSADQQRWRERQQVVERELQELVTRTSR